MRHWGLMRARNQSVLSDILPPEERVIEAVVARYQRVAPAVTRFARALAGNDDLQVRLGSRTKAGKDEITLDPGVFQSAYSRSAPVTPTEVALTSALHEAIHLIATDLDERRPIPAGWLAHKAKSAAPEKPSGDAATDGVPMADLLTLFASGADVDDDYDPTQDDSPDPGTSTETNRYGELLDEDLDLIEPEAPAPVAEEPAATTPADATFTPLDAVHEIGGQPAEALFLAIEDARQERRYLADYGGVRSVLSDLYTAAIPDAIRDARALGQYSLACFLIAGDYSTRDAIQRRTAPAVAAAIDDAMAFLDTLPNLDDAWDVGAVALQLLEVARLHGLVTDIGEKPSASKRDLRDEADGAAISESVDAVRLATPSLRDRESYEDTRDASQSVSAEAAKRGDAEHAGDPATDQLVRVSESPTVFLPTGQSGKLVVGNFPDGFRTFGADGRDLLAETAQRWGVAQRRVSGELYPLFLANQRRGLRSGYDAGDLSPYAALLLGAGVYDRMFERRDLPMRRSYAVSVLVDGSASMLQPRPGPNGRKSPWAMAAASLGAWTLGQLCNELQIEFEIALFNRSFAAKTDDTESSFSGRRHGATGALRRSQGSAADRLTRTVNHYLVKSFDARWRSAEDVMAGLFWTAAQPGKAARAARTDPDTAPPVSMFDKAANVDEYNLAYAANRLGARRVTTRILVVLADGMTRGSVQALADTVDAVEHGGTTVLGIGIGDTTVQAAYARNQVVERPDELAKAMVSGVRSTLFQTLASVGGTGWWANAEDRMTDDERTFTTTNPARRTPAATGATRSNHG